MVSEEKRKPRKTNYIEGTSSESKMLGRINKGNKQLENCQPGCDFQNVRGIKKKGKIMRKVILYRLKKYVRPEKV